MQQQYVGLNHKLYANSLTHTDSTLTTLEATLLPNILTFLGTTSDTQRSHQ